MRPVFVIVEYTIVAILFGVQFNPFNIVVQGKCN